MNKQKAVTGKVAKNKPALFWKLFFRRKLTILDFDQANFEKAVKVLRIHRMKEVPMHIFYRKSWRFFFDPSSGWGFDIMNLELD